MFCWILFWFLIYGLLMLVVAHHWFHWGLWFFSYMYAQCGFGESRRCCYTKYYQKWCMIVILYQQGNLAVRWYSGSNNNIRYLNAYLFVFVGCCFSTCFNIEVFSLLIKLMLAIFSTSFQIDFWNSLGIVNFHFGLILMSSIGKMPLVVHF